MVRHALLEQNLIEQHLIGLWALVQTKQVVPGSSNVSVPKCRSCGSSAKHFKKTFEPLRRSFGIEKSRLLTNIP